MNAAADTVLRPLRLPRFNVPGAFLTLTYHLLLVALYVWAIGPIWNYLPLAASVSVPKVAATGGLTFILGGYLAAGRPSQFYFMVCALLILIPTLVLYSSMEGAGALVGMTLLAFGVLGVTLMLPPLSLPTLPARLSAPGIAMALLGLATLILAAVVIKGGVSSFNLNPMAVYDFRDQANQTLQGVLAYLVPIATNVAIPLALLIAMARRLRLVLLLCLGLSVLFFGFVTLKSYVFYPFMVAAVYVFLRGTNPGRMLLLSLIAVVVASSVESWFYLQGDLVANWLTIFTTRRMLMIPSIVNFFYVDYFSSNPFYYWATSKITLGVLAPPSTMDIADLIGWTYLNEGSHANTGWVGSGYAQAGAAGVAIYSLILGLILKYLDACALRTSTRLVSALFFIPLLTMITSSDSVSVFLTQGLLSAVFLFPLVAGGLAALEPAGRCAVRIEAGHGLPGGLAS